MTITNPTGQTKIFKGGEYYTYLLQVERNNKFQAWTNQNQLPARYSDGIGMRLNTQVVESYLEFLGYKIKRESD